MYLKNNLFVILFFVLSCQPVEILKPALIDISNFENISINTKEIEVNTKYNPVFAKNNIEDQIQSPPIDIIFPKDTDDPKIFFLTSSPIITTFLPCWISSKVKFLPFANLYPAVII